MFYIICQNIICLRMKFKCHYFQLLILDYVLQSSLEDEDTRKVYSCIDLYFVSQVNSYCYTGKQQLFDETF